MATAGVCRETSLCGFWQLLPILASENRGKAAVGIDRSDIRGISFGWVSWAFIQADGNCFSLARVVTHFHPA